MRKSAFGDGKVIRGRFRWQAGAPPVVLGHETVGQARARVLAILDALVTVLVQHGQKRQPRLHSDNLFDFLGTKAAEDFNLIIETMQQGDARAKEGQFNVALLFYLNALELVLTAKCHYGMLPETAFE